MSELKNILIWLRYRTFSGKKIFYQIFKALALKILSDDKDKNYVIRYKDSESVEIIEKYQKITMGRAFYKIDKIVR